MDVIMQNNEKFKEKIDKKEKQKKNKNIFY